jgi:hypothetical protein
MITLLLCWAVGAAAFVAGAWWRAIHEEAAEAAERQEK